MSLNDIVIVNDTVIAHNLFRSRKKNDMNVIMSSDLKFNLLHDLLSPPYGKRSEPEDTHCQIISHHNAE